MRHSSPRRLSGALLGALAVMSLQGCKRIDMVTDWTPASPAPAAYLEDGVLASRVRAALILSPVVNSFNIGVESHQGVVLLSGMAADPTQIDLAVFVAQTVPGVSSVDSFMFISDLPPELTAKGASGARATPSAVLARPPPGATTPTRPMRTSGKPASASGQAGDPVIPVVLLSHPLGLEPPVPDGGQPPPSRWVSLAHRVLGIRSIQEELLIK